MMIRPMSVVFSPVVMSVMMSLLMHLMMFVSMGIRFPMIMSVQILHIMIVVLMLPVEHHIEITGVNARLLHSRHCDVKSLHKRSDAVNRLLDRLSVRAEIQQCADSHVPADPGIAFQVQCSSHLSQSPLSALIFSILFLKSAFVPLRHAAPARDG